MRGDQTVGAAPDIPLLVLIGPTATGKTRLSVALAEHLLTRGWQMEAVSADSRQIYQGMDIATAKPTALERARLTHHMLDVVKPDESYTLAEYQADADAAIKAIWSRGRLPLLVGGTGLYVRAVVDGLAIPAVAPDPALRSELEAVARDQGTAALHARLAHVDPVAARRIDSHNPRRLIRALEVCLLSGRPISEQQGTRPTPYQPLILGLTMELQALYLQADTRIDLMLQQGLVEETRQLVAAGYAWELPSMSSLGYREIRAYLRAEMPLPDAVASLKLATHHYIRRQLTWFRASSRTHWLDASEPLDTLVTMATDLIIPWLS
ncbi:MAG: tRNA (adenosine(37)-N6)-dimethylallyltransferase MiaA, partial [Chloroflexi bacterium]